MNVSGSSGATVAPGVLAGSLEQSIATLVVSGLNRDAESHLFVFATFDVPQFLPALNPQGPDQVARIRVETGPGRPSRYAFLRKDGTEINPARLGRAFLDYFAR